MKYTLIILLNLLCLHVYGQKSIQTENYEVLFDNNGRIVSYVDKTKGKNTEVSFRSDKYAGFSFEGIDLSYNPRTGRYEYFSPKDSIFYYIHYKDEQGILSVKTSVENLSHSAYIPETGIKILIGLNTYQEKYPDWNDTFFPTMLRCERTHFSSYFMTPNGNILSISSPDPVASWQHEYESNYTEVKGKKITHGLHRIFTSSVYLLHCLPLPQRHPQNLFSLSPRAKKEATFFIQSVNSLEEVNSALYNDTKAPTFSADLYTQPEGKKFTGELLVKDLIKAEVRTPRGEVDALDIKAVSKDSYSWEYLPYAGVGEYTVTALNSLGKFTEMKLYVRPSCSFYLNYARKEALRSRPTTTHHGECFIPLYTYSLAKKYTPSALEDKRAEEIGDSVFAVLYDKEAGEMRNGKFRIQDAAIMAGALADKYQITHDEKYLQYASSLANWLIDTCQREDGGFYNNAYNVHYTCVAYMAKSIMEVADEEKKLAAKSSFWKKNYEKHRDATLKAIDDLEHRGDNIGTEGQMTFEDGMISCSTTQLALAALKTPSKTKKEAYLKQAIALNKKHRCLTQKLIPDARMNGATLRFWEYQYTVNLMHNAMNSPCGWSAWKYYGSWYLYLLTGEYEYMREVLNGLGSSMQLLDAKTKELHFGFMPDPYIDAEQFTETPKGSRIPVLNRVVLGEQYIPQISSWHFADPYAWRPTKFGIDNFVHEVYKCMVEVLMDNAYIIENENGELQGINCSITPKGNTFVVNYSSPHIKNLHINLKKQYVFEVNGKQYEGYGLKWMIGYPDDLLPYE